MFKLFSHTASAAISLACAGSMAQPIILNPGGGYYDIELVDGTIDEYNIYLADVIDFGPANFGIGTQAGGASGFKINNIYVLRVTNPSEWNIDQQVRFSVRDIDDPADFADIAYLGNIFDHSEVETEITVINVTGDLGWDSASENGLIVADELWQIRSLGNWYSSVVVDHYDDSPGQPTQEAVAINAVRGGLYHYNGRQRKFLTLGSDGFVGAPGAPFEIGGESIEKIEATSASGIAFGNIVTPSADLNINKILIDTDFIPSAPIYVGQLGGMANTEFNDPGGLEVGRDFGGTLQINSLGQTNPQTGERAIFKINRSMLNASNIVLPDNSLTTQLTINASNDNGQWFGTISVGPIDLTGPIELDYTSYYTALSSELGGGAVGLAPFNFHQRETAPGAGQSMDCNPYQKETRVLGRPDTLDSVDISHYGPIYVVGDGPHFRVEFLPWMDVNQTWVDRTSLFEVDFSATSNSSGSTNRIARIKSTDANTKGFKAAGTWRIRPIPGKVKCAGVTGNPDVRYVSSVVSGDLGAIGIWSWYQFDVSLELEPGVFALDSGNGVQSTDLTQWMLTPYETNADGETDTQDFVDLADQYTGN